MGLIEISENGMTAKPISNLPEVASQVLMSTAELYRRSGYQSPWVGYLAIENGVCVGTCGFKSAPQDMRVEIAYFTFPENEGRGVATRMASELIRIARHVLPSITIFAQTLAEDNASTTILKKLGFQFDGELMHPEDGKVWEWSLRAQQLA